MSVRDSVIGMCRSTILNFKLSLSNISIWQLMRAVFIEVLNIDETIYIYAVNRRSVVIS